MLLELHFTENALTLKFFLQRAQRLIDVVITNTYLHVVNTTFLSWICKICRTWPDNKRDLVCPAPDVFRPEPRNDCNTR